MPLFGSNEKREPQIIFRIFLTIWLGFLLSTYCLTLFGAIIVRMSRQKFIIILILVISAFIIYPSSYQDGNSKTNIWTNDEKDFFKPIDVVWRGEIISTMTSGSCIGLKGEFDNYRQAMACLPDKHSNELWKLEGIVTVTGKWLGIACAYKNTVFGECVPDVIIENIGQ